MQAHLLLQPSCFWHVTVGLRPVGLCNLAWRCRLKSGLAGAVARIMHIMF